MISKNFSNICFNLVHYKSSLVTVISLSAIHVYPFHALSLLVSHFLFQVKCFKDYVQLYLKDQEGVDEEEEMPRKVVHEVAGPRWEVCVTASNVGFKQASFVNSIATTKV